MAIASAVVTKVGEPETGRLLVEGVRPTLAGRSIDLCLLFASAHFEDALESIAGEIQEQLQPRAFIGVTGETVLRDEQELENQPGIVLWAAHLPDVSQASFHFSHEDMQRLSSPDALREHLGIPLEERPYFLLLGDPFSINPLDVLAHLEAAYPGRPALGGMASAADQPGQNALIFEGQMLGHGLVGVALWGALEIDMIVSQGCRPIGKHMVITRGERNIIQALGGRSPLNVVNDMLHEVPPRDLELAKSRGLLIGRVINEYQGRFDRGDFLIRNPIGFDASSGAMAVNDMIRIGQTVQFHVRDSEAASEDLSALLDRQSAQPHAGGLVFTCNGRGTRLFPYRSHDVRAVRDALGAMPLGGFFCAGEIGPIGERNFLHGHTVAIGLFRPSHAPGG